MRKSYQILRIVIAAALVFATAGIGEARTRKGDKLLAQGRQAEQRRELDKALELCEQALGEDPGDPAYQIATRRLRFKAAQAHVDLGQQLRAKGDLDAALAEFQRAYAIDPSSMIAEQELRRTLEMIERNKKAGAALAPEDQGLTPADLFRKRQEERLSRIQAPPELKPLSKEPIRLKMNNQPARVLYETVTKIAGINVVFDPDMATQDANARRPHSIELVGATIEDALDYLAALTKTFWKPLSSNAIFVTADNQAKRREYEDSVVKVFYLSNATTPQELTEMTTVFRTVPEIRKVFQYNSLNAVIVRGSPDQISLAEKLIYDLDKPRAEVVVDVLVMEANRAKTRNLAATLASNGTPGINAPIQFTPRNPVLQGGNDNNDGDGDTTTTGGVTTTTSSTQQLISLARIAKISTNDFSITLPGALLQAVMTDRNTKVLQSPQVRAASGQKATLRIGDKVPVASGGIQPFGGTSVGGGFGSLYSQFQFIDVGVNVDITPFVHGDGEVTLKVMLEISNVRDRVDLGGISQPVIGQRKVEHEIRIREGQASLLGGLMQDQDSKAKSGIPGLASVPGLGRFFSSESIERSESELLIVLVPHIVRTPGINDLNLRSVAAGTDTTVRIGFTPREGGDVPTAGAEAAKPLTPIPGATPVPATPVPVKPAPGQPAAQPPAQQPAEAKPATPQGPPAPQPPPEAAKPAPQAQTAAPMRLTLRPSTFQTKPGATFTIQLEAENARDLFAAPFHLKFDPQVLRLNEVKAGTLLSGDGQKIVFTRNILNDTGDCVVNLNRMPGTGGVSGSGVLAVFTFQAVKAGTGVVTFSDLGARDSQLARVQADIPQSTITVK